MKQAICAEKGLTVEVGRWKKQMILRYRWLVIVVLAALLAVSSSGGKSAWAVDPYDPEELQFLEIINEYRQSNGLEALILSDALTLASERHSEDMSRYNFFVHETVASSYFPVGSEPWDRMALSGYDYNTFMAENLIAGYETAEEAFKGWRASPGHNANMLDDAEKVIGIARIYVPDSEYGWYWTTNFGGEVDTTSHAPGETPSSKNKETEKSGKAQSRNTDREGVENGSMNGEDVWGQKTKREGNNLIGKDVARLGGYDNAEDEISQEIRIQKGQRLFYRVWIKTEEKEHPADGLVVRLTGEAGKHLVTLDSHTDTDAEKVSRDGWIWDSVNLSRFADETVTLNFLAKTDEERPTTFYVDDVALK